MSSFSPTLVMMSFKPLKRVTSSLILKNCFNICPIREQDGQASGGNDFGGDDWIFTIREKDPKKLQNGEGQSGAMDQVRREKTDYSSGANFLPKP